MICKLALKNLFGMFSHHTHFNKLFFMMYEMLQGTCGDMLVSIKSYRSSKILAVFFLMSQFGRSLWMCVHTNNQTSCFVMLGEFYSELRSGYIDTELDWIEHPHHSITVTAWMGIKQDVVTNQRNVFYLLKVSYGPYTSVCHVLHNNGNNPCVCDLLNVYFTSDTLLCTFHSPLRTDVRDLDESRRQVSLSLFKKLLFAISGLEWLS